MKVAIVGCGALGCYYGARLHAGGHETHFLLRSDYEAVRRHGLRIHSVNGDMVLHPHCARTPEEVGPVDLVLIALKTTANHRFDALIRPLVGKNTLVLTLQNGLGNEEALAGLFGAENILGGLCFVCLNRMEPGVVVHSAHGRIVLGEFRRKAMLRTHDLAAIFEKCGVPCKVTDDLELAHWEKLVWNIPFNGLGVAGCAGWDSVMRGVVRPPGIISHCLTTRHLLEDARWEKVVRDLMKEIILAGRANGCQVPEGIDEKMVSMTRVMDHYKASTLIDFERGHPLELESMFLIPLRLARNAGVPTPRLAGLCSVLKRLNKMSQRPAPFVPVQ